MPRVIVADRQCRECGRVFPGGPRAWYCPTCRVARKREAKQSYLVRKRSGGSREIGASDICIVCGRAYIIRCGHQKYCPECAPCAVKEEDAKQGLDHYRRNAEAINPPRKLARRMGERRCVVCGKIFACIGYRTICSDECRAIRRREYWHRADAKRRGSV